jgi:WD40 repeat protein
MNEVPFASLLSRAVRLLVLCLLCCSCTPAALPPSSSPTTPVPAVPPTATVTTSPTVAPSPTLPPTATPKPSIFSMTSNQLVLLSTIKSNGNYSMMFSLDGKYVAVSTDQTITVYDRTRLNGDPVGEITDGCSELSIHIFTFSVDGRKIVFPCQSRLVLWDFLSNEQVSASLEGVSSEITSVAYSPDGSILATGDMDGQVILWDTTKWTPLASVRQSISGTYWAISDISFSPDGRLIAWSGSSQLFLWDRQTQAMIKAFYFKSKAVVGPVFSPDGSQLAYAISDLTSIKIEIRDAHSGSFLNSQTIDAAYPVLLRFSNQSDRLMILNRYPNSTLVLFDFAKGDRTRIDFGDTATDIASAALSPDEATLAIGYYKLGKMEFWEMP